MQIQTMEILAISISGLQELVFQDRRILTGICKQPVRDRVYVTKEGIQGDAQADRVNHGGVDKALYVYDSDNYRYWEQALGRPLPYGQLGENLVVAGLLDSSVHIGDVFRLGEIEAQVTQPRVPCHKLGMRMEALDFVGRFHVSGRVGFYLRVLKEGWLGVGDRVELLHQAPDRLHIADAMLALNKNPRQQDIIRRALANPALSQAWRDQLGSK